MVRSFLGLSSNMGIEAMSQVSGSFFQEWFHGWKPTRNGDFLLVIKYIITSWGQERSEGFYEDCPMEENRLSQSSASSSK